MKRFFLFLVLLVVVVLSVEASDSPAEDPSSLPGEVQDGRNESELLDSPIDSLETPPSTDRKEDEDRDSSSSEAEDERASSIQRFRHSNEYQSLMFTLVRRYPHLNMADVIGALESVIPSATAQELRDPHLPYLLMRKVQTKVAGNDTDGDEQQYREYFDAVNEFVNGPGWIEFSREVSSRLGPAYKDRQRELAQALVYVITTAAINELKDERAVQNLLGRIELEMSERQTTESVTAQA